MKKISIKFYVDDDEYDRLEQIAYDAGDDIHDYMKELINDRLEVKEIDEEF